MCDCSLKTSLVINTTIYHKNFDSHQLLKEVHQCTPMVIEAFHHLPVRVLAGTVPVNSEGVLKAVRHGEGTPVIHRFSHKAFVYTKPKTN